MKDNENWWSTCTACMDSVKNFEHQLPPTKKIKQPDLTEPGQEMQTDFSGKLHNKYAIGEPYVFIEIGRYSKWHVVWVCKATETKEVLKFLENLINFCDVSEKIKSDRGSAFISKEYKTYCKSENVEMEYSPPRLHTSTEVVDRAMQTVEILINVNLEDEIRLTESINSAFEINAIHDTDRAISEPIWTLSRWKTENQTDQNSQRQQKLFIWPHNIERFSTTEADTEICGLEWKTRGDGPHSCGPKRKIPWCTWHTSPKRRPVKPVSGNFQYP